MSRKKTGEYEVERSKKRGTVVTKQTVLHQVEGKKEGTLEGGRLLPRKQGSKKRRGLFRVREKEGT